MGEPMLLPESRHPEWDLLYRAGWTFGRIAARHGAPASTVHRHLQQRTIIDPGFKEDYLANVTGDPNPVPRKTWMQRVEELEEFVAVACRPPVRSGRDRDEQNLAAWLSQQRVRERAGQLSPAQRQALDAVGDWRTSSRERADEQRWLRRLGELKEFLATEGNWPRYEGFRCEDERILGVWLHRQRQRNHRNLLTAEEVRLLNGTVPGWNQPHRR